LGLVFVASILSTLSSQIQDLRSELVLTLELGRGEGCDIEAVAELGSRFADAVRPFFAPELYGAPALGAAFPAVEQAYRAWRAVRAAFDDTLDMAYANSIPRANLLLDDVRAGLDERVGEPLSVCYTELHSKWRSHLSDRPWDAFQNGGPPAHVDEDALERALGALAHGDELDVEDALDDVTGGLRYAFAEYVARNPGTLDEMELNLWKRPEILVAGDYWGGRKQTRLLPVLRRHSSERFAWAVETLEGLFAPTSPGAAVVAEKMEMVPEPQRARFYRCLMMHPDYEVRRHAAGNADEASMWKVLTPRTVPCATILTLLERLVGSTTYTVAQHRIFFDTVYRRLLSLGTRSDVLYARGIVRILIKMNFFMEDDYFARLMTLLDYLEAKERAHGIVDGLMPDYIARLKEQKERAGSVASEEPTFEAIPLVVLRKLARDGHFWQLLSSHPIVKIARETVAHIATAERALWLAGNHRANQEVLRAVGRRRDLFRTRSAQLALLGNPRTPVSISLDYANELGAVDVEKLLRTGTVHPELRAALRNRLSLSLR
jgi:hypothetical protein